MKAFTIIIITAYCCYYANCVCIQGKNCPIGQGYCKKDKCICEYNFWTLRTKNQSNLIYCNYQKYNRFYLLLFEFFIPTVGHFIAGKYYFAIPKLCLLLIPLLSCFCGYISFYNEEGRAKKNDSSNENELNDNNSENDNRLHEANKEEKKLSLSVYLPVVITFISLGLFVIMHIIDIICYLFAIYKDGNGVPLA